MFIFISDRFFIPVSFAHIFILAFQPSRRGPPLVEWTGNTNLDNPTKDTNDNPFVTIIAQLWSYFDYKVVDGKSISSNCNLKSSTSQFNLELLSASYRTNKNVCYFSDINFAKWRRKNVVYRDLQKLIQLYLDSWIAAKNISWISCIGKTTFWTASLYVCKLLTKKQKGLNESNRCFGHYWL